MWNERYASDEFVYGTEPNAFLVQNAKILTGPAQSFRSPRTCQVIFERDCIAWWSAA